MRNYGDNAFSRVSQKAHWHILCGSEAVETRRKPQGRFCRGLHWCVANLARTRANTHSYTRDEAMYMDPLMFVCCHNPHNARFICPLTSAVLPHLQHFQTFQDCDFLNPKQTCFALLPTTNRWESLDSSQLGHPGTFSCTDQKHDSRLHESWTTTEKHQCCTPSGASLPFSLEIHMQQSIPQSVVASSSRNLLMGLILAQTRFLRACL